MANKELTLEEKRTEALKLIGFGNVGKKANMAYQTVSRAANGVKLRTPALEKEMVKGAIAAANEQIDAIINAIDIFEAWARESK